MSQLEEGWPLGLQPRREFFGSASFSTLLSDSTNSFTDSNSSDLDTESTGSFFHDNKSNTLGRLMGVPTREDLPRRRSLRSTRLTKAQIPRPIKSNNCRPKTWCFSLCPMDITDVACNKNSNKTDYLTPSLGQFLAVERRACHGHKRGIGRFVVGPNELGLAQPEMNSLFVDGLIAPPPRASPLFGSHVSRRDRQIMGGESRVPLLFSCMCG